MIECQFHETKRERKYYEGKKEKALEYIQMVTEYFDYMRNSKDEMSIWSEAFMKKLTNIEKLVNDI